MSQWYIQWEVNQKWFFKAYFLNLNISYCTFVNIITIIMFKLIIDIVIYSI